MKISFNTVLLVFAFVKSCQSCPPGFPNYKAICSLGQWTAWQEPLCGSPFETRTRMVNTTIRAADAGLYCQEPSIESRPATTCEEICSIGQWTAWQEPLCGSPFETRTRMVNTTIQAADNGTYCQEPWIESRPASTCENTNKIFIAPGVPSSSVLKSIEIVDLQGNGQQCTWQYPIAAYGASGGLMPGGEGIICGGGYKPTTDACHLIPSMEKITMKKKRLRAASLVFNGRLLVAGGLDENDNILKSTEWVSATAPHTEDAGDLPIPLQGHTMELISLKGQPYAMVIGGLTSFSGPRSYKTFLGRNLNGAQIKWTEGPPLIRGRYNHASALLQHQETAYIMVAGGQAGGYKGYSRGYLTYVEILKITSTPLVWTSGPGLPEALHRASMVSLGTKVILLGGWLSPFNPFNNNAREGAQNDMYQLTSPNGKWQKLPQTLKRSRAGFFAFTIPTNWTHC